MAPIRRQETWYGADGRSFHPGLHYYVGGNSKVYGAALFRMRERDFRRDSSTRTACRRAWPLKYDAFEPLLHRGRAAVSRPRAARRRSERAALERPVSLSAGFARAAHPGTQRQSDKRGPASVSSALGHSAGREGRQSRLRPASASAAMPSTAFPVSERQGGRSGHVCRSGAEAHPKSDAVDRRLCLETGDRCIRQDGHRRPGDQGRAAGTLLGRYRRRRVRRFVVGAAAAAIGATTGTRKVSPTAPIKSGATTCATISRS